MGKYSLKCVADGSHELHGPNGRMDVLSGQELRDYARNHLGMNGSGGEEDRKPAQLASLIETTPSGSRFSRLVRDIQMAENVCPEEALNRANRTDEGKRLWEEHRRAQLSESATLGHFTQDRR